MGWLSSLVVSRISAINSMYTQTGQKMPRQNLPLQGRRKGKLCDGNIWDRVTTRHDATKNGDVPSHRYHVKYFSSCSSESSLVIILILILILVERSPWIRASCHWHEPSHLHFDPQSNLDLNPPQSQPISSQNPRKKPSKNTQLHCPLAGA